MVSTPSQPSASETAAAQTASNRETAITQQQLNMVNQVTPYGNLTYTQNGNNTYVDSNGKTVTTPSYTATTTLSPEQQSILDQTNAASLNLATLANNQSKAIDEQLSNPFSFTNDDASNWAYDLGSGTILKNQTQDTEALKSQLIAQGIRPGSAQWDSEMSRLSTSYGDQLNSLALSGRSQAYQEALSTYNNPVNTISALLSGGQVTNPTFTSTPTTSVANTDVAGITQNAYNNASSSSSSSLGGLFGLLSGGVSLLSDVRAKEDIVPVGMLDNGLKVYRYRYKGHPGYHIGLIAQEVEKAIPHAVTEGTDGLKRVRYDIATEMA